MKPLLSTEKTAKTAPLSYRSGDRCGQCGRSHFYVGRITAECGFCGVPVALAESQISASPPLTEELRKVDLRCAA